MNNKPNQLKKKKSIKKWKHKKNIWQGESTLKVSHFSPKKVMYNEYYNMQ
jgi:hypothetical protein